MTKDLGIRSPSAKVGGLFFFGRTLDKIRMHAKGELPADYQPNLGIGFDERVVKLLGVDYDDLVERVKQGGSDEEILQWCFSKGRKPSEEEIHVWNEFMRKYGWNDPDFREVEVPEERSRHGRPFGNRDDVCLH